MGYPLQGKLYILGATPYGVNGIIYRGGGRENMGTYKSYVSEVGPGGNPDISPVTEMVLVSIRPALPQPKGTTIN